ncbi:MAG: hypothetical protein LBQ76_06320 [Candidatus Fibromonas sp.]|jgi:hypothetical protein|nr:hypothetical protein [Candidatus Fibromonas sp.]
MQVTKHIAFFEPRWGVKKAIEELQQQSIINGTSGMTMEEIDAEIALCRKERATCKA